MPEVMSGTSCGKKAPRKQLPSSLDGLWEPGDLTAGRSVGLGAVPAFRAPRFPLRLTCPGEAACVPLAGQHGQMHPLPTLHLHGFPRGVRT